MNYDERTNCNSSQLREKIADAANTRMEDY
nr:MAG TPA: hypothetical protein [Caudoviricetes sp.]